jgi:hypothetical protein
MNPILTISTLYTCFETETYKTGSHLAKWKWLHDTKKPKRHLEAKHLCREKPILRTVIDYLQNGKPSCKINMTIIHGTKKRKRQLEKRLTMQRKASFVNGRWLLTRRKAILRNKHENTTQRNASANLKQNTYAEKTQFCERLLITRSAFNADGLILILRCSRKGYESMLFSCVNLSVRVSKVL